MRVYHNLYVSEELTGKKQEILYKIERNVIQFNKYVIVLSKNKKNQLEFYDSSMLLQKYFKNQDSMIVGIADGYEGALLLVKKITEEVYRETEGADLRDYLLEKQRESEESKE